MKKIVLIKMNDDKYLLINYDEKGNKTLEKEIKEKQIKYVKSFAKRNQKLYELVEE